MNDFFIEFEVLKQVKNLVALDRQLERWGWFRGHEGRTPVLGWRFRTGAALIRFGRWLQERGAAQPVGTTSRP